MKYTTCKHCGERIQLNRALSGHTLWVSDSKVFPQYCPSSIPNNQLHEPIAEEENTVTVLVNGEPIETLIDEHGHLPHHPIIKYLMNAACMSWNELIEIANSGMLPSVTNEEIRFLAQNSGNTLDWYIQVMDDLKP
jgi:hypothetical protein